jgi:hypothetical protein
MIDFWTIGGFSITILFGLASIPHLRMYSRTGLKNLLFRGLASLLIAFFIFGMTILYIYDYFEIIPIIIFLLIGGVGALVSFLSTIIASTSESGFWVEFGEKTTFRQRLTGNIPILKFEKPPPPAMSRRTGLIFGIFTITLGCLLMMLHILFKIPGFTILFFIPGAFAFIFGLLLVIFSIIYLDKGKKSPE